MYISINIRFLRTRAKMSQDELAAVLDKGKTAISAYERGAVVPPIEALLVMSKLFDVDIDSLVKVNLEELSYAGKALPSPSQANEAEAAYRNNELLTKLMAMKVLELAETLKDIAPEAYEAKNIESVMDSVRNILK